jgi:succinyl-CoA synthetase beta subunit
MKLKLEVGLNYVDLDGTVGCMVNGLAMAMDMDLICWF